ncbi:MAG TPA: TonB-dependent receptor [Pelobium sp.]|nr:TonB-dependent receptor [Pelobium sp.]
MRLKAFNTLVILLFSTICFAQYGISGRTVNASNQKNIANCTVYLSDGKSSVLTDQNGFFEFKNLPKGTYTIIAISDNFRQAVNTVSLIDRDVFIEIKLNNEPQQLQEIIVQEKKAGAGFTHLRGVEGLAIYEGKKSELINIADLTANLATNNARQVYAKVPGLNIWENEGAGLQLSIGGRGLDPNRTANFNVRQNGYDISADALGYPESYYTPPVEAIEQIQIVRGAASLQYGTQFGGLINFVMKKPVTHTALEIVARQTIGSFDFSNSFISASGTKNKLSYYTFYQRKQGNGWRPNSNFNANTAYGNVKYQFTAKTSLGLDFTHMDYLAQQPGGLTDDMFATDARQSNRERNWFKVNWNLYALHFDHQFNAKNEFNLRFFGLSASRYSVGFRPNRVATIDDNGPRDLIKGDFENWGTEARYLKKYNLFSRPSVLLAGLRYYHGFNHAVQGEGSTGKDANFDFSNPAEFTQNDYDFPNRNTSVFLENIFNVSPKFSITPGLRFEYINTKAEGYYRNIVRDNAGNVLLNERNDETKSNPRKFVIAGLGLSYKPNYAVNIYGNISQNYRSITFSDIRIANPSAVVDPNLLDEKGYSLDLGIRSEQTRFLNYDVSLFYLNYNNRIGEVQFADEDNRIKRNRTNIGQAIIRGIEAYAELDVLESLQKPSNDWKLGAFTNVAFIKSDYRKSIIAGVEGKEVEFVPQTNLKAGLKLGYKKFKASYQFTYLSQQFTDATNAIDGGVAAVIGEVPAYQIMDFSSSYQLKRFTIEASVNNLANQIYYTRRATGYPGPGILPSDGRSFFIGLAYKF